MFVTLENSTEMRGWVDLHLYFMESLEWGDGTHINYNFTIDLSYQGLSNFDEIVFYFAHNDVITVPRHTNIALEVICQANPLEDQDW
ncbi:hypothetical protein E2C01_017705 [Portunus trituberculatus]|uniref:Uncharacterized protein n=1 Tax=Portunus trituberculatus TaxID=210409 RepID=A0A5B7DU88_PORTR|nr:hypothetical protein [Portunus trituberculatus]